MVMSSFYQSDQQHKDQCSLLYMCQHCYLASILRDTYTSLDALREYACTLHTERCKHIRYMGPLNNFISGWSGFGGHTYD